MRVVHVSCVAPPQGGGIGTVADREVRLLRQAGVDAVLVAPSVPNAQSQEHIIRLPGGFFGNAGRLSGLEQVVRGADLVHLHYPFYGTAGLLARMRYAGTIPRLAMTLHMDAYAPGPKGWIFGLHRLLFQSDVLLSADALFVSSLDYARSASFGSLVRQCDPRIQALPFGVESDRFVPSDVSGSVFGIPAGVPVIGTVSVMDRAHPFKGIDVLIRSVARLPQKAHLLLVGDGDRRLFYERLARRYGLERRTHFVGRLSEKELVQAFQRMQIFAFPSTSGAEAFGLAMLEAMSCGVPVVASALPGVRSVARDAGILIPPGQVDPLTQALQRLLDNKSLRSQFGSIAREKALRYDWNAHGKTLLEAYQALCGSLS